MSVIVQPQRIQVTTMPTGVAVSVLTTPITVSVGVPSIISGALPTITATAASALSGHRAVTVTAGNAAYADVLTAPNVTGITTGAAGAGEAVTVQTDGELTEPSWAWAVGMVYLSTAGLLTQTPPLSGAITIVGWAITPTRLLIRIEPPIYL